MKQGRVVVVTGGGAGIGKAIAESFVANGDTVFILGRDKDHLETVAVTNKAAIPVVADITNVGQVEHAIKSIVKQAGTIDVLVNAAGGVSRATPGVSLADDSAIWNFVIEVNLTGVFNVVHGFMPHLKEQGGRVILISSIGAFSGSSQPNINGMAYAAAKSGVHGLARTLVGPLAKRGITINCVAPGVIDHTNFFGEKGIPEDRKKAAIGRIPAGHLGEPKDVATGVMYLASEDASFVTGEILNINGGAVFGR